jgi:hypothetical protein
MAVRLKGLQLGFFLATKWRTFFTFKGLPLKPDDLATARRFAYLPLTDA